MQKLSNPILIKSDHLDVVLDYDILLLGKVWHYIRLDIDRNDRS